MCPTECVSSSQTVCGSDGNTYGNECELHVRACTQQVNIEVAAQGDCSECLFPFGLLLLGVVFLWLGFYHLRPQTSLS